MNSPRPHPWTAWSNRQSIPGADQPGVYLLARFDGHPPKIVDPASKEVFYIGETCSQSLLKRWYQFGQSAFLRKNGHAGGWTFSATYCKDKVSTPAKWLYIAALPVVLDAPKSSAYIRYVERLMLWKYVERFGELPRCNKR